MTFSFYAVAKARTKIYGSAAVIFFFKFQFCAHAQCSHKLYYHPNWIYMISTGRTCCCPRLCLCRWTCITSQIISVNFCFIYSFVRSRFMRYVIFQCGWITTTSPPRWWKKRVLIKDCILMVKSVATRIILSFLFADVVWHLIIHTVKYNSKTWNGRVHFSARLLSWEIMRHR